LAGQTAKLLTEPFTLVIEIEAWNIRERADGGQPKALRQQGQKIERWHWVYLATVFRLDHRGQTAGGRAIISGRLSNTRANARPSSSGVRPVTPSKTGTGGLAGAFPNGCRG
jgi:hypothetical protein